jgi:very-short-patch-repair endonuclease
MYQFTRSLDELVPSLSPQKVNLRTYLHRNFTRNTQFIETPHISDGVKQERRGGHNRVDILLTEEAFELLQNSYNLRNKNITELSSNIKITKLVMPIETQTIGFIENTYRNYVETIRQFIIGKYRVDLYFPQHNIVVECDEFGHVDRDKIYEHTREQYLISQGNTIIRFNPNEPNFDLSNVLNQINVLLLKSK